MRQIAHRIVTTEGMFLTVRLVKRRVSRYPTGFIIKTMREFMSRPPEHPLFIGCYREPPRTKVFYKCPPHLISDEALASVSCSREVYKEMFHSVPKVQKWDKPEIQGRLLLSVVESSPFAKYYDEDVMKRHMALPQEANVQTHFNSTALDLTMDYSLTDSPKSSNTPRDHEVEEGEIIRSNKPDVRSAAVLPPLYALADMADKLNSHGNNRHASGDGEIHSNDKAMADDRLNRNCSSSDKHMEKGEETREQDTINDTAALSVQDYAEKAVMRWMYQDKNGSGGGDGGGGESEQVTNTG